MGKLLSSSGLENVYLTMALQGDYSFASTIDDYDLSVLYNDVKRLGYKENIVDALFQAFHIINPFFTFQLVYSLEKYKDFVFHFLFHNSLHPFALERCVEQVFHTSQNWIYPLFRQNIEEIGKLGERMICYVFQMAYSLQDEEVISKLVGSKDMTVRTTCLSYVFSSSLRGKVREIYPGNITDYFVLRDEEGHIIEKIEEKTLSECATQLFDYHFNEELYLELMYFIIDNYSDNHLLSYLLSGIYDGDFDHRIAFLEKHAFALYDSSCDAQILMYERYPYLLDQKRIDNLESFLNMVDFAQMEFIESAFVRGLGNKILTLYYKYSQVSSLKERKFLGDGTCSCSFLVGDYLFKISNYKYPSRNPLCPRSYLIIKTVEEYILRNGGIIGAVEVQKCASVKVRLQDEEIKKQFLEAVDKEGLVFLDAFREADTNVYLLKDYRDADCDDPEKLPTWFKKYPAVLVDRDLVYYKEEIEELKKLFENSNITEESDFGAEKFTTMSESERYLLKKFIKKNFTE